MRRMPKYPLFVPLTGFALLLSGCDSGKYTPLPETGATLEGKVTYGNQDILVGLVIVTGGEGPSAQDFIGEDGRYKLKNVPLGQVTIAVNVKAGDGNLMSKRMSGQKVPKTILIPEKYTDPKTSEIKTKVEKGENKFDIIIPTK
jgi:hypothetical protein